MFKIYVLRAKTLSFYGFILTAEKKENSQRAQSQIFHSRCNGINGIRIAIITKQKSHLNRDGLLYFKNLNSFDFVPISLIFRNLHNHQIHIHFHLLQ